MSKDCGGCGGEGSYITQGPRKVQPHSDVVASYGLCLSRDEFVQEKCIWVVDLLDGTKVFQDDDRPGLHTPSAWKRLGYYIQDYPDNRIAKMRLRFGSHIVELPGGKQFYFYSKGLVQSMTQTYGLDFHIVGWLDNNGQILCVWYKVPELVVAQTGHRPIEKCQPEQLLGDLTNIAVEL